MEGRGAGCCSEDAFIAGGSEAGEGEAVGAGVCEGVLNDVLDAVGILELGAVADDGCAERAEICCVQ